MKKIMLILGVLSVLILGAILVIPMVVDVDQYRPQILKAANEQLNGKLELGQLKLSLWGSVRVKIDTLNLVDAKGAKVVSVKNAFVTIPWSSVFGGSPLLTFNMENPEVRIIKGASGKMNVFTLMKNQGAEGSGQAGAGSGGVVTTAGTPSAVGTSSSLKLPAIVTNARLGVDIRNASFEYKDETAKSETKLNDLNFRVKDLSLSRRTEVDISGILQSSADALFKVSGPFRIELHASPRLEKGEFQGLAADLEANFDDLELQAASAFYKKKGMTAQMKGELVVTKDQLTLSKVTAKFFNAEIDLAGKIMNFQTEPAVDFSIKSNSISLAPWNELIPILKDYALSGSAAFEAKASGPAAKMKYTADFSVKDLKAKSSALKSEPVVNIAVKISTDKVDRMSVSMKAPGNELSLEGSVLSFTQPKIDLKVTSSGIDLDQLVNFPPPSSAGGKSSAGKTSSATIGKAVTGAAPGSAEENVDALLDPLRKNEVLRAMTLVGSLNFKMVQAHGVRFTDLLAKVSMKNLGFSIDSSSVHVWDGVFGLKAQAALAPKTPTYSFSTSLSNLDLKKAVSSQMELFKNTLLGKINFKMDGSGSSFNVDSAKRNLSARGSMKVLDAEFASIDIGKMASEAINKALDKVGDKIPAAKGKSIKTLPDGTSKYEFIASNFSISGGRFSAPDFNAKAIKNQGLDLRGTTEVGLLDGELKADWEIIDTYNLTKARDVGFDVSGIHVPSVLADGVSPVMIPVSVACKVAAPCPSYGKVPEHFLKVAFGNTKRGATEAVKNKATEKVKEVGTQLLKGLFR